MKIIHEDLGNGKKKTYAVYTEEEKAEMKAKAEKAKAERKAKANKKEEIKDN